MWLFCLFAYLLGVCVGFAMALFFVGIKNDEKYPREPPLPKVPYDDNKKIN